MTRRKLPFKRTTIHTRSSEGGLFGIDLDRGVLRVTRTRVIVNSQPTDSLPKTTRGQRSVPLDDQLVSLLKAHRAVQAAEKLAAGPAYEDGGWLVADELGRPYSRDTISGRFDQHIKRLGLRRIRLHDARHTAATLLLADWPVKVVADMLGQDPRVTLSTYAASGALR